PSQPGTSKPAQKKRDRRPSDVPDQDDEESPPQAEEESASDTQHATGKEEDIATGVKDWIPGCAPGAMTHHLLLHPGEPIRDRKEMAHDHEREHKHSEAGKLKINGAANLRHRD